MANLLYKYASAIISIILYLTVASTEPAVGFLWSLFLGINQLKNSNTKKMKRQRNVNNAANTSNPPKFEGKSVEAAATVTVGKKKKAKIRDADHKKEEENKENSGDMGLVGPTDNYNVMGCNWEEFCWPSPWLEDQQMCWGSVWLPVWDMDFIGDAFSSLYNDVVWDDDIWNLKKEIPIPSPENAK